MGTAVRVPPNSLDAPAKPRNRQASRHVRPPSSILGILAFESSFLSSSSSRTSCHGRREDTADSAFARNTLSRHEERIAALRATDSRVCIPAVDHVADFSVNRGMCAGVLLRLWSVGGGGGDDLQATEVWKGDG